jgi:prepilin-type processing-associated H-X9-DG protein
MQHITDGASNTLLVGETNYSHQGWVWSGGECATLAGTVKFGDQTWAEGYWALSWGHMSASFPQAYNNSVNFQKPISARTFRSDHPGGVQFVLLDGSVRMLSDDSAPEVRRALVTRAGDEVEHRVD